MEPLVLLISRAEFTARTTKHRAKPVDQRLMGVKRWLLTSPFCEKPNRDKVPSEAQATLSIASAFGVCICLALIQGHRFINLAAECPSWHTVLGESRLLCWGDPGQLPWGGRRKQPPPRPPRPALPLSSARPNKTPTAVLHLGCGRSHWSARCQVSCWVEATANVVWKFQNKVSVLCSSRCPCRSPHSDQLGSARLAHLTCPEQPRHPGICSPATSIIKQPKCSSKLTTTLWVCPQAAGTESHCADCDQSGNSVSTFKVSEILTYCAAVRESKLKNLRISLWVYFCYLFFLTM